MKPIATAAAQVPNLDKNTATTDANCALKNSNTNAIGGIRVKCVMYTKIIISSREASYLTIKLIGLTTAKMYTMTMAQKLPPNNSAN
jgi:hypothetical protein